ncbi:RNA polymerase factor sigma-54 [Paenibacillus aestuarii]|uniref:RNA polymerase factor sigma-54 n=1 Tax=Paenibacillus aestuarii TaxID=516965 RepID=A0ABW0K334_9BACL|nr:RNA polymerase factor sigma-54 [Paenibacillus aestuarii]
MQIHLKAETAQTTHLNITPTLKQSIHMLQLSAEELAEFLQAKAVDNPLLEIEWTFSRAKPSAISSFEYSSSRSSLPGTAAEETIETMLHAQLRMMNLPKSVYQIASYLAGNMNDSGYLDMTVQEASNVCSVPEGDVLNALAILQRLEPAGIAARNLQECLLLQIRRDPSPDPWAETLISGYMQELAEGKTKPLAEKLRISKDTLWQSLTYIRSLNPRPGLAFSQQQAPYIRPDAIIQRVQGSYALIMTDAYLPKVALNESYYAALTESAAGGETAAYVRHQARDAQQLLKGLEQRKTTLRRVIEIIISEQKAFFDLGVAWLKPMVLKAVAQQLGLHESTISRAVQHKYVQTPQGLYELKFFFPSGVKTAEGAEASAASIKSRIRQLVDDEDKQQPLSDQQLTSLLQQEGVQISRRTVMKYREEMNILSSRLRS